MQDTLAWHDQGHVLRIHVSDTRDNIDASSLLISWGEVIRCLKFLFE